MACPIYMLATQNDPIKTSLNTTTTCRGQTRQHLISINITAHARSVLGRTYWQLLTNPDIIQLNATTTPSDTTRQKDSQADPTRRLRGPQR